MYFKAPNNLGINFYSGILSEKDDLDELSESASSGIDSDEVSGIESVEESEEGTPVKVQDLRLSQWLRLKLRSSGL